METARIIFRNPYVTREGDALPDWKKELPLSFTIKKVKAFLEKEYPGKPFACDIRLVFSGKMLSDDTLSLRKILENEDLSSWHTFHLIASRTGFSPSVSPAEKKIPSDLSPLRGNTPDSVEEEEKNNLSTVTDNNSIKPHLTSNTNSSINVENQTTSTSSRIVGSDGASNNVSSRNNNTFPGQVQHSTSNVAPMLQRHPLAPTHIGGSPQQQQLSPEYMQQYYQLQQQQWMAYYQQQQQQYVAMMSGNIASPQQQHSPYSMNFAMMNQQIPPQQQIQFNQQAHQEAYYNYYRYMQQMYAAQQQAAGQQFQQQQQQYQPAWNINSNTTADGLYRRGGNASRQRVTGQHQQDQNVNTTNANDNNNINNVNNLEARRGVEQAVDNNRNNNNVNVDDNVINNNQQQGFFDMLQIRLLIKLAFFYYIFSQDQNRRNKIVLMAGLGIYYCYKVGLLHFIARTVTCGRYGNRNNNDNNNDNNANNGNGGNLMEENVNIPTPPVGNIPNPVQSVGFFCDLKCFVISFVFSLYPTWYPVAIPSPTPPTPVVAEEVNNNVEQEVNDENNNIQEAINHAQPEGIAQN